MKYQYHVDQTIFEKLKEFAENYPHYRRDTQPPLSRYTDADPDRDDIIHDIVLETRRHNHRTVQTFLTRPTDPSQTQGIHAFELTPNEVESYLMWLNDLRFITYNQLGNPTPENPVMLSSALAPVAHSHNLLTHLITHLLTTKGLQEKIATQPNPTATTVPDTAQ